MKAKFVNESFERNQDPLKSMNVGLSARPMAERGIEFNEADIQKASEFLESTGLIKISTISDRQKKNLTLKYELIEPYYYVSYSTWDKSKTATHGTMHYLIQGNGYLRKLAPSSDRTGVIIQDPSSTYLELAKLSMKSIMKDIKKSEKIKNEYR